MRLPRLLSLAPLAFGSLLACEASNLDVDDGQRKELRAASAAATRSSASFATCGDGEVGWGERCDPGPAGLLKETCESIGYLTGELACADDCRSFDISLCKGAPACGDGHLDPDEECDDGNLRVEVCSSADAPCTTCGEACLVVDGLPPVCGDNTRDEDAEECDGEDLGGLTCGDLGLGAGHLRCADDCTLDPIKCDDSSCGDGLVSGDEECDTATYVSDCGPDGYPQDYYHDECTRCTAGCQLEVSRQFRCGMDGSEYRDDTWGDLSSGYDPAAVNNSRYDEPGCSSAAAPGPIAWLWVALLALGAARRRAGRPGPGPASKVPSAVSTCAASRARSRRLRGAFHCAGLALSATLIACTESGLDDGAAGSRDVSDKESPADTNVCGDGYLDYGEACEPGPALSETCESIGYTGGVLACASDCSSYDVSGCEGGYCGNGYVDDGEICDDGNTVVEFCAWTGVGCMTCGAECQFVEGREPICGDGELAPRAEDCDGALFEDDRGCRDFGYNGGEVLCGSDCRLDLSACLGGRCGDGAVDEDEECEPSDYQDTCPYGQEQCEWCDYGCHLQAGETRFCGNGVEEFPEERCDTALVYPCYPHGRDEEPGAGYMTCVDCQTLDDSTCRLDEGGCAAAAGDSPRTLLVIGLLALVARRRRTK